MTGTPGTTAPTTPTGILTQPRPTLGILPRYLWLEMRSNELVNAIGRRAESRLPIPLAWVDELNEVSRLLETKEAPSIYGGKTDDH